MENCPFDITPYDKSNLIKTPKLANLNYTNQDFWSMKARLTNFIKEKFADSFNDFVESDLAIVLIENWAFIADTLSFKMDQIANEIFIDTVSEVDNAFRLSTLVGFKPQPPICARSLWSGSINNILETDLLIESPVTIPISTELGTRQIELYPADKDNQPIFGENIYISAGSFLTTAIVGIEGTTYEQSVSSSGEPNQFITLTNTPVIWNSIRVAIDGNEWQQVDYFTDSQPRREFRVEYDPTYTAYVIFGNTRGGQIPSVSSSINIILPSKSQIFFAMIVCTFESLCGNNVSITNFNMLSRSGFDWWGVRAILSFFLLLQDSGMGKWKTHSNLSFKENFVIIAYVSIACLESRYFNIASLGGFSHLSL